MVRANILAAKSDLTGEIFNIGGGNSVSVKLLILMMEEALGKKANIRRIEKQKGDVENTLADVTKANNYLGWRPQVDIARGLKNYIRWSERLIPGKNPRNHIPWRRSNPWPFRQVPVR